MNIYQTQSEWDQTNQSLCNLFGVDYTPSIVEQPTVQEITTGTSAFAGRNHSEASKEAISENMSKWLKENPRVYTPERLKKMSDSHKGQVPWSKGLPMRGETKAKLRARGLEQHLKNGSPMLGRKHSEETKAKIRAKRALQKTIRNQYSPES